MPMIIGMVMTSRKTNIKPMIQPQQSTQRLVQSTSQPPYVNRSSMNRLNLQSMRLGSNYSMNSLYNSPYRSGG